MLTKENIKYIYTLTPMQEGMFFHTLIDKSSVYFEQVSYRLRGNLDPRILEKSLNELFKRHDILRTVFIRKGANRLLQVVLKEREADFYYEDISSRDDKEEYLRDYKEKDRKKLFDLSKDVLMRVAVFYADEAEYEFTWSHHHILMDGWCTGVVIAEFFEIYNSILENRTPRLPEAGQYRDYIKWLEQQDRQKSKDYWKTYLQSYEKTAYIPRQNLSAQTGRQEYKLERGFFSVDKSTTGKLNELAGRHNATLNTLMQTLWGILLGKYNGSKDSVFGAVVSVRPGEIPAIETMVGLFINTIPVRITFDGKVKFVELLRRVQLSAVESEPHYYFPLTEIQAESPLKQNLLDHIFAFENFPISQQIRGSVKRENLPAAAVKLEVSNIEAFEQTNYDFNVIMAPAFQLNIRFEYNGNVYDTDSIKKLSRHFIRLLDQVADDEYITIDELTLLSQEEKKQLLYDFNDTAAAYPRDKTIHRLFEEQAVRIPDSTAVVQTPSALWPAVFTYRQLENQANRLVQVLREKGVEPCTVVGLLLESSFEMIVGILAVLKAEAAYLPIDTGYPEERKSYMLKDSGAKVLLTGRSLFKGGRKSGRAEARKNTIYKVETIFLDDGWSESTYSTDTLYQECRGEPCVRPSLRSSDVDPSNSTGFPSPGGVPRSPMKPAGRGGLVRSASSPDNLAYIIYTSGTTGKPKGVMIGHRNVVRLMFNDRCLFDFKHRDVWTMFHSYCFDFSVWEMYGALLYGGKLVLIPGETARDTQSFFEILLEEKVTVLNQTPSAFYNLISESLKQKKPLALRYVIFGGEALAPLKLKPWRDVYPGINLVNMFGITETTVHVTYKEIGDREITSNISNIGKPIPTLSTYVLDPDLKLVPIGIAGELWVGGEGVGRGYVNNPELTAEKFISARRKVQNIKQKFPGAVHADPVGANLVFVQNPHQSSFITHHSALLYKTGDLVRLLDNGEMEYLGRIDHQVQIRGYRVELGEIENRLLKHEEIRDALVIAKGDQEGGKYLCAYIVTQNPEHTTHRTELAAKSAEPVGTNLKTTRSEKPSPGDAETPELDVSKIREYLSQILPDYMIPNYFVPIDHIPLTANGKIDRKSLPEPGAPTGQVYIGPRDELDEKMVEIWQKTLELEKLGINDNFFYIGGDSIKAIRLLSALNAELDTSLKIADLFTNETIEKLSRKVKQDAAGYSDEELEQTIKEIEELKEKILAENKLPGDIEDIYPMSDIEKGMVFHSVKDSASAVYHDQVVYQVKYSEFDPQRLKKAFTLLAEKHPILRTGFNVEDFREPVQIVYKSIVPDIEHIDISHLEKQDQEAYINNFSLEDRQKPFNTKSPPLWRFRTFARGQGNIVVLFVCHHAIIDGWSEASLMTELNNTYLELKTNPDFIPKKLKNSYKQFVIEQAAEKKKAGTGDFWRKELAGYKRLEFPGTGRKTVEPAVLKGFSSNLGSRLFDLLSGTAEKYNTTLKNLCFAAYVYMLDMILYENDLVVGLVTHNRPICEDGDRILGCFLNTIPVRIQVPVNKNVKWSDYIRLVDEKLLELTKYDRLSLLEIVRITGEETQDRNPIFDTLFNLVDFHVFKQLIQEDVRDDEQGNLLFLEENVTTNTLFNFGIRSTPGRFIVSLSYTDSVFSEKMAEHLYHYFKTVLNKFIHEPENSISKEELIPIEDREKLLLRFNSTREEHRKDKTIDLLFSEQAALTPDNIAVVSMVHDTAGMAREHGSPLQPGNLTYRELEKRSNQLAFQLRFKGTAADTVVGMMMERSVEMIIGILGILKAGSAYCPMDPGIPAGRKQYILADSKARILVSTRRLFEEVEKLGSTELETIFIEECRGEPCAHPSMYSPDLSYQERRGESMYSPAIEESAKSKAQSKSYKALRSAPCAMHSASSPENLAYVLYTSGSTGKPKGVMVEHRNVNNLVCGLKQRIYSRYDRNLRVALLAPFVFDASVKQIFAALLLGHSLYIIPEEARFDGLKLTAYYNKHLIDISDGTPTHLYVLLESITGNNPGLSVTHFLIGGEPLPRKITEEFLNTFDNRELHITNLYGPTECCVDSTSYEVDRERLNRFDFIPIGTPLANQQVYIVDAAIRLQPPGAVGELCIAGDNVSRGYLGSETLTREKFITNPFSQADDGIMYRSGDLARWLPDGNLEFSGRIDQQVKVRGFRIELGEIESCLLDHEDIKEAVVVVADPEEGADNETNGNICAYFVPGTELKAPDLREYLSRQLPAYMIPVYFVVLAEIPVTANGKIDRKALPAPQEAALDSGIEYAAPRDALEEKLVDIWQNVLGRERIGINDNFFLLGGDSIKSIQISARMGKEGFKIEMRDLFNNPTIGKLAPLVKKKKRVSDQSAVSGEVPLTPIQHDFFNRPAIDNHHFNHSLMLYSRERLTGEASRVVFKKISEHHDALRMVFIEKNGAIIQQNLGLGCPFSLEIYDLRGRGDARKELGIKVNRIQAGIDLEKGPLMKVGLFHLDNGDRLLIVIHHLVVDGISWRLLLEDIETLYQQYNKGDTLTLPLKTDSFKEWSEKLSVYANSETFLKEISYWKELESTEVQRIEPDFGVEKNQVKDSLSESVILNEEETDLLLTKVNDAFGTEINDILLTALALTAKRYQGLDKLSVALEGHGREEIADVDITRTVGWFTCVYPVILDVSHESDLSVRIKTVKETLRQVPNRGIGYGILQYLTAEEHKKEIGFFLKPQVSFNYLGQFDRDAANRSFEIARESSGNDQSLERVRKYELDIVGMITGKRLVFSVIFNKKQYKRENIRKLLDFYREELSRIISYCTSREYTELTPSDFDFKQLSIEDMDAINKMFDK